MKNYAVTMPITYIICASAETLESKLRFDDTARPWAGFYQQGAGPMQRTDAVSRERRYRLLLLVQFAAGQRGLASETAM